MINVLNANDHEIRRESVHRIEDDGKAEVKSKGSPNYRRL